MERDREEPPPTGNGGDGGGGSKGSSCEECGEQPWKYRCPGCARLTCSLPCVQAHKRRTACTGKRPHTDPVPLARFDDNNLISDYNFLEETKQATESAHRLVAGFGRNFGGPGGAQLPSWLFFLRKAAQRRGIRLYFLPRGMAKREHNRSRHNHRKDCIYWSLEWRFNSIDVVVTDHEIDEHATLISLLEKHLCPGPWKDKLTQYRNTELRDLKLFIQKSAKESGSLYQQLDIEEPLGPQLRGTLIVEYPSISVFLPSDSYDFEVEKKANKLAKDEKNPGSTTDAPLLEGNEFHEEEIEEGEFAPETQVIDLKDCGTSKATDLAPVHVTSEFKIDSNVSYSGLPHAVSQVLHSQSQREDLNQYSKMAHNATSGSGYLETKSCMELCPLVMEETRGGGLNSKRNHIPSHHGNLAEGDYATISKIDTKIDSLGPSSISITTSDGVTGPQQGHSQQSEQTSSSSPEALESSSPEVLEMKPCMKVCPLDTEENQGLHLPEVLDLEQEMRDTYPELFGDIDPDDFLSYDLEMVNGDESIEALSALLWGDLEEGEIPSA